VPPPPPPDSPLWVRRGGSRSTSSAHPRRLPPLLRRAAGEIHELREELANPKMEKKKEAVKKVIAAMTVGKDVSMLFTDVVNCIQTARASRSPRSPRATAPPLPPPLHPILAPRPRLRRERLAQVNIELKKLVYLYLINYAKSQPDLAILAVNTFVKDTQAATPLAAAAARAAVERRRRATDYPPSSERLSPPTPPPRHRPPLPPSAAAGRQPAHPRSRRPDDGVHPRGQDREM
jgi:hypothetical protein